MSTNEMLVQPSPAAEVRHGLDLLIGVIKKHAFYPEGNPTLDQAFYAFQDWLALFLQRQDVLHIDIGKTHFFYQGNAVQEEKPGERAVIFPLFRDGVLWIEFLAGIAEDELWNFIRLINQYRELREESENDLVSALWEANFQNIRHKAVDKFWETQTLISIDSLKISGSLTDKNGAARPSAAGSGSGTIYDWDGQGSGTSASLFPAGQGVPATDGSSGASVQENDEGQPSDPKVRLFLSRLRQAQSSALDPRAEQENCDVGSFWKLTRDEQAVLREMIAAEERRNEARDSLNVILALMRESLDRSDRELVQEFVADEFRSLLAQGDFIYTRAFVEHLVFMRQAGDADKARFADEIAAKIASPAVFGVLDEVWPRVRTLPNASPDDLHRLLFLLPPAAIEALAPMAARASEPRARAILLDAVAFHAWRSRSDVSAIVGAMPSDRICEIIASYAAHEKMPPIRLLTRLTRHGDPLVRETAARALIAANAENLKTVFHLIDDPDRNVCRWLLACAGSCRQPLAERLLLDRIDEDRGKENGQDAERVMEWYFTLGRCGSKETVGLLRDILLKKNWRARFGLEKDAHRVGAAIALLQMPPEWGAAEALREAETSRVVGIRRAHARACEMVRKMRPDAHD